MTISNVLIFLCLCYSSILSSQNTYDEEKAYLRYDNSIGTEKLSNFIKYSTKINDTLTEVEEYYRFTIPYKIKAKYNVSSGDIKEGMYVNFTVNGDTISSGNYRNDKREGRWFIYKEGDLSSEEHFVNDERHGESKYYYNGNDFYTGNWINGKPDGYKIKKSKSGNTIFKGQYKQGKLDSINVWYFDSGQKQYLRTYKDKKQNGLYQQWYEDGQLHSEGTYVNNEKVGDWAWYYENGAIASKENYNAKGRLKKALFYTESGKETNPRKDVIEGVIEERKKLQRSIQKHIKQNFEYPREMHNNGFEAKVYVKFKVSKSGEIVDVESRGHVHPSFLEKAEQIILTLPKQKPAVFHNLPIEVPFTIPMVFKIM